MTLDELQVHEIANDSDASQSLSIQPWTPDLGAIHGEPTSNLAITVKRLSGRIYTIKLLQELELLKELAGQGRRRDARDADIESAASGVSVSSNAHPAAELETTTLPPALASNWAGLAMSGLSTPSYERLALLSEMRTPGRGNGRALRSDSLRSFLKFWMTVKDSACEPEFALCPSGNLQAEWHESWRRHLEIEFCGDGTVFFGLFSGRNVHEGREHIRTISAFLRSYATSPLTWG